METTRQFFLSQLLPYDPDTKINGDLKSGLKEYQALLRALFNALQAIEEGSFEKFDSLVGENACEIRAIWICKIAPNHSTNKQKLKCEILKSIHRVDQLLEERTIMPLMQKKDSLMVILKRDNLDTPLTSEEMLILKSHLLCEAKSLKETENQPTSIFRTTVATPKKMLQFGDITPSFAKSLVSKLRRLLSEASVEFVRKEANVFQHSVTSKMVSEEYTTIHNALTCIPMFWTYKTMLQTAQREGIPLIIHAKFLKKIPDGYTVVDEEHVFFDCTENGHHTKTPFNSANLNRAACVIQGVVVENNWGHLLAKEEWHKLIDSLTITDVVLAGAADHRQYPDPMLDERFQNLDDKEHYNYKALAKYKGFSADNPSGFFIQHVYPVNAEKFFAQKVNKTNHESEKAVCYAVR